MQYEEVDNLNFRFNHAKSLIHPLEQVMADNQVPYTGLELRQRKSKRIVCSIAIALQPIYISVHSDLHVCYSSNFIPILRLCKSREDIKAPLMPFDSNFLCTATSGHLEPDIDCNTGETDR